MTPEESASLRDFPNLSIKANHGRIRRFSDDTDGNNQRVAEVLERKVEEREEEARIEDDASVSSVCLAMIRS